jgi:hypothetical protein
MGKKIKNFREAVRFCKGRCPSYSGEMITNLELKEWHIKTIRDSLEEEKDDYIDIIEDLEDRYSSGYIKDRTEIIGFKNRIDRIDEVLSKLTTK